MGRAGRSMYIAGAPMIMDFDMLVRLMTTHESGWIVAERFRFVGSGLSPRRCVNSSRVGRAQ